MARFLNSWLGLTLLAALSLTAITLPVLAADSPQFPAGLSSWATPGGVSQVMGTGGLVYCLIKAVLYLVKRSEAKDEALVKALNDTIKEQTVLAVEVRDAMRDMTIELKAMRLDLQSARLSVRKEPTHG